MFNRTIYNSKSEVVAVTRVIEKSITPDKVTEMYDSIREQVEKDILRTFIVKDNNLDGVVLEVSADHANYQKKLLFRFKVNGKEYIRTDISVDGMLDKEKVAEILHECLKETIANKILKENIVEILR